MPAVKAKKKTTTISIYTDYGVVFEYEVANAIKAREHMAKIIATGYRHTPKDTDDLEWIPPHHLEKVVAKGAGESTNYKDNARAT